MIEKPSAFMTMKAEMIDTGIVTAGTSVAAATPAATAPVAPCTPNTLAVAQSVAPHLRPGTVFLDLNSASPGTKQAAAQLVDATGAHYVEAGVMTSVPPYGIKVPMLLGGGHAAELAVRLQSWGMDAKPVSDKLGVASAIKMSRSVMIKGLEAMVIESFTAARAFGVGGGLLRRERLRVGERKLRRRVIAVHSTLWVVRELGNLVVCRL